MTEESEPKSKPKHSRTIAPSSKVNKLALVVFVLVFGVIAALLVFNTDAAKPSGGGGHGDGGHPSSNLTPSLYLSPSSQKVAQNSTLSVQVWEDSSSQTVNAVQANFLYSKDKLDFVNIDFSASNFGIAAEGTGSNGLVTIARGNIKPLSGKQLIAIANFKVTDNNGTASLSFNNTSKLLSDTSNSNVLAATYGGSYTLSK
jgi:hypothetical protein